MGIRRATVEDAAAIAVVHVRSWQAAYRGLIAQDYLDGLDPGERAVLWEQWLAAADWPRQGTLVAEVDAEVVGFANFVPTQDEDADPRTVAALTAIYLLPAHWGAGLGRRLMTTTLDALGIAYQEVTLWVLDTNDRARRFYEAGAWRTDGAAQVDTSLGIPLRVVRYRLPLPRVAPSSTRVAPSGTRVPRSGT